MSSRPHRSVKVAAVATVLGVLGLTGLIMLQTQSLSVAPGGAGTAIDGTPPTINKMPTPQATNEPATLPIPTFKNIVFVLADDLDSALFQQVPRLAALSDRGMTFTNHVVTDSLCCPSRVSILRSQYVHNHLVVSNSQVSGGGWPTFAARGEQNDYLPTWLQSAGVTTALIGKFLNEYPSGKIKEVPPGWSTWVVPTVERKSLKPWQAYTGYNYTLNINGELRDYGSTATDFLPDVLTQQATDFIATASTPFFLELATFSPHDPAPVADRHALDHPFTAVPRTPSFNVAGIGEAPWLSQFPVIPDKRIAIFDKLWQQRARSAESVADAVDSVLATLATTGHSDDTLVVVTSDNGFHAGVHRLPKGKRTAYREDTVVPLVLIGTGIPPGTKVDAMTSTVDFGVTFAKILGAQSPTWADGRDLTPFFAGQRPANWRTGVISESMGVSLPSDPDYSPFSPPSFTALRTEKWLYTEYADGGIELFDRTMDPYEMNNIAGTTTPTLLNQLHEQLQALHSCSGATCLVADSMPN